MRSKKSVFLFALAAFFIFSQSVYAVESELLKKFVEAADASDEVNMNSIVEKNKDKIPAEIKSLMDQATRPQTTNEERESKFYIAERMANAYKNVTGDVETLKEVKKKSFESKLSKPFLSTPVNGIHTIEAVYDERVKNIFRPDNIIIKNGETVNWVNNDTAAHILASMSFIGIGGILSPRIEPGQSWKYRFEKPGEYYYICFIHKVMYGKITVEK